MPSYRVQAVAIDALGHLDDRFGRQARPAASSGPIPGSPPAAHFTHAPRLRRHIDAKTYLTVARRARPKTRARASHRRRRGGEEASSIILFAMDDKTSPFAAQPLPPSWTFGI